VKPPVISKPSGILFFGTVSKIIDEFFLRREDIVELGNADESEVLNLVSDLLGSNADPIDKVNHALRALKILQSSPTEAIPLERYEAIEVILTRGRSRLGSTHSAISKLAASFDRGELYHLQSSHCPRVNEFVKRWHGDMRKCDDHLTHENLELILDEIEAIFAYDLALVSHIAQCDEHDDESPIEFLLDPPQELKQAYDLYYEFISVRLFTREFNESESDSHE